MPSQEHWQTQFHRLWPQSDTVERPGPRMPVPRWKNVEQELEHLPKVYTGEPVPQPHVVPSTRPTHHGQPQTPRIDSAEAQSNPHSHRGTKGPLLPLFSGVSHRADGRKRILWLSKAGEHLLNSVRGLDS
ncbi:hypothetical protein DL93DRAFT_2153374, partial [Clavulina sp. PMI_390]